MKGCCRCVSEWIDRSLKHAPTYHKEIMRTRTLIRVDLQRESKEVAENWGQGVFFLDGRRAVCRDKPERTERALVQVWRFSFDHFDSHDTQ